MAKMGFRTFQEMIGRTEKLRPNPSPNNPKSQYLDFEPFLKNALEMRPGVNIKGGSLAQDFSMDKRLVR